MGKPGNNTLKWGYAANAECPCGAETGHGAYCDLSHRDHLALKMTLGSSTTPQALGSRDGTARCDDYYHLKLKKASYQGNSMWLIIS